MPEQQSRETIGQQFMRLTQHQYQDEPDQFKGAPQPPLELPVEAGAALIDLPGPDAVALDAVDLRTLIENRETVRRYTGEPLSLAALGYLLWATQGVKRRDLQKTLRTVPSAGARHAFETLLLVNRVEGLAPGLYRYVALRHKLLPLAEDASLADRVQAACGNQPHVATGAVTFFWVAVASRMTYRYGQRGYRYLHLDAGHVCQNLYLAAQPVGCGVCAIGSYADDALNDLLGVDGVAQFVIYGASVGRTGR